MEFVNIYFIKSSPMLEVCVCLLFQFVLFKLHIVNLAVVYSSPG